MKTLTVSFRTFKLIQRIKTEDELATLLQDLIENFGQIHSYSLE